MTQDNFVVTQSWLVLDDGISAVVRREGLQPIHQVSVASNKIGCFLDIGVLVDNSLTVQVTQFEKFGKGLFVADEFTNAIEKLELFHMGRLFGKRR